MYEWRSIWLINLVALSLAGIFVGLASAVRSIEVEPAGVPIRMTAARLTFGGSVILYAT